MTNFMARYYIGCVWKSRSRHILQHENTRPRSQRRTLRTTWNNHWVLTLWRLCVHISSTTTSSHISWELVQLVQVHGDLGHDVSPPHRLKSDWLSDQQTSLVWLRVFVCVCAFILWICAENRYASILPPLSRRSATPPLRVLCVIN